LKLEYFIVENNVVDNEKNIKQNDEIRNENKDNLIEKDFKNNIQTNNQN
jgi:hypothetical protein